MMSNDDTDGEEGVSCHLISAGRIHRLLPPKIQWRFHERLGPFSFLTSAFALARHWLVALRVAFVHGSFQRIEADCSICNHLYVRIDSASNREH